MRPLRERGARPWGRRALWGVSTVLIILALHGYIGVAQCGDNNSWLLDLGERFIGSFSHIEYYDLLALFLLPVAFRWLDERDAAGSPVLAVVFALLFMAARSLQSVGSLYFFYANGFQVFYSLLLTAGWSALFELLLRLLYLALAGGGRSTPDRRECRRLGLWSFLAILVCWLPWSLAAYPGTFCPDSLVQLAQALGLRPWTSYSPVFSTWLMGALLWLGERVASRSFGCFLYLLLQTALGALVFSLCVRFLRELGLGLRACMLALAFFALTPLWGCFSQFYEKDLLYAELATLNLVCAAAVLRERRCSWGRAALLILSGVLMSLARNNGVYASVPLLLALALYVREGRRPLLAALGSVLGAYLLVTAVLYPALGVEKGSVRDLLSLPLQQTARYVSGCPEEVTPEERAAIDAVVDLDRLAQEYDPVFADPVKDMYREDCSKLPAYFRVWSSMGLRRPLVYLEAFLHKSYGYLAPVEKSMGAFVSPGVSDAAYGISAPEASWLPAAFQQLAVAGISLPAVSSLYMPGLYTWLILACMVLLGKRGKKAELILFIPALVNLAFCLGSPLHCAIRYALPVVASAPLLLGWTAAAAHGEGREP